MQGVPMAPNLVRASGSASLPTPLGENVLVARRGSTPAKASASYSSFASRRSASRSISTSTSHRPAFSLHGQDLRTASSASSTASWSRRNGSACKTPTTSTGIVLRPWSGSSRAPPTAGSSPTSALPDIIKKVFRTTTVQRLPLPPDGELSHPRIMRAVPGDRPRLHLAADGAERHLLFFRARRGQAHDGARRCRRPNSNRSRAMPSIPSFP